MSSSAGASAPPTSDSGAPWGALLGLQPLAADAGAAADLPGPAPVPQQLPPPATPAPPPPPARVEGVPTPRDRGYTYILQLPVTRVRQLCRDAKLKQFGRKDQSQPRLFWGTCAIVDSATEGTEAEKWAAALPGLSAWLAAPHREHSTAWLAAPPPSARPHNFHTFYAHQYPSRSPPTAGATAAVRAALSGPPASSTTAERSGTDRNVIERAVPLRPAPRLSEEVPNCASITEKQEAALHSNGANGASGASIKDEFVDIATTYVPVNETPQLRDRAFTYVVSLPVTAIREICKRLKLKQFGRKVESQARLFWYWEDIAGSLLSDTQTLSDTDIPDPLPGRDVLPGFEEWLNVESLPAGKWVRAPPASRRPPISPGKRRESFGGRRKRFTLHELARVVCALVHTPATRAHYTRVAALSHGNEIPVREFWITVIEPLFNDLTFAPQCAAGRIDPGAPPVMPRTGEELRRHFEESKPLFVVAFRKWQDARALAGDFDSYLGDGKLTALERRASVLFNMLKCGTDEQYSDVLAAVLREPPETDTVAAPRAPSARLPAVRSSAVPIAPAVEAAESSGPPEPGPEPVPTLFSDPGRLPPEAPVGIEVEEAAQGATAEPGSTNGMVENNCNAGSILGKRPRPCCEKTAQEIQELSRRIDEALVPVAKLQSQLLKMQREKALVEAIIVRRTLHKDLVGDSDPASVSLREANAAALAQLTRENEKGNNP